MWEKIKYIILTGIKWSGDKFINLKDSSID